MPKFTISMERTQIQSETFIVEASDLVHLTNLLKELENDGAFGRIDDAFDGGEVESIEYEVTGINPCAEIVSKFSYPPISVNLQKLLDE